MGGAALSVATVAMATSESQQLWAWQGMSMAGHVGAVVAMATNETNNKMAAAIKPTKCALRYDPPTLVLFYTDQSTGE